MQSRSQTTRRQLGCLLQSSWGKSRKVLFGELKQKSLLNGTVKSELSKTINTDLESLILQAKMNFMARGNGENFVIKFFKNTERSACSAAQLQKLARKYVSTTSNPEHYTPNSKWTGIIFKSFAMNAIWAKAVGMKQIGDRINSWAKSNILPDEMAHYASQDPRGEAVGIAPQA